MASQTVFNTTELLESILLLLPLPDLLRSQAVCTQWQQVLRHSSLLQEELFLRPTKVKSIWLVDITNLPSGMGPLHRRYETHVRIRSSVSSTSADMNTHYGLSVMPVHINPLCVRRVAETSVPDIDALRGTPITLHPKFENHDFHSLGTCGDMLLTQPPVQYVTLEVGTKVPEFLGRLLQNVSLNRRDFKAGIAFTRKIFIEGGVRVGDILSAMKKLEGESDEEIEGHVIYMHGAIDVTAAGDEIIRDRSKQLREEKDVESKLALV